MENEKDLVEIPETTENTLENVSDEDWDLSNEDIFNDIQDDTNQKSEEEKELLETPTNNEENLENTDEDTGSEPVDDTIDDSKILEVLKGKVKYNHEEVEIKSLEDLINTYQKGLNYDKKVESYENSKLMSWLDSKAKDLGMTRDQYIDKAIEFEENQRKAQEKEEIDDMVESGVPEEVAKEVIATRNLRKQLEAEKEKLNNERETELKIRKENQDLEDFVKTYPNVKAEEVPKEVFDLAQKEGIPLKYAFSDYQRRQLEQKSKILETNNKNYESNIGSLNGQENTPKHKKDSFLEGFDEDY